MVTTFGSRGLEEPIRRYALNAVGFDDGGYVLKLTTEDGIPKVEKTSGITDDIYGVLVDATFHQDTTTVATGRLVDVMKHGIVPVKSEAVTWVHGTPAYLGATDGYCTNVDGGSASILGEYVGQGETVAAGDKVEIDLDSRLVA